MSNTNNRYLHGTEFTNISVRANCDNTEDGSIEASGTLFVNTIREYDISSPGVNVEGSIFQNGQAIITSTEPSLNLSSASLIVQGGISILKDSRFYGIISIHDTTNSVDLSSGSLIIDGSLSVFQNANIGGIITLFNTQPSYNVSTGSFISLGGISIQNTEDATSFTSGGSLTIAGGASIAKTLFANLLKTNNATISQAILTNSTLGNANVTYGYISSLTAGNIIADNITTDSLYSITFNNTYSSIANLYLQNGTLSNVLILDENVINSTITNLTASQGNFHNITSSIGNFEWLTVGNLHVNTNFEFNNIVTNLSTANIISDHVTIASAIITNLSYGNLFGLNQTTENLLNTNLTTSNANILNSSIVNTVITNASISNLSVIDISNTNQTSQNSLITNLTASNSFITNLSSENLFSDKFSASYVTAGYLVITGTIPSFNSTTGTVISYGGISIDVIENATSITSGGGLTVAGGASIAKDVYIGYTLYVPNISSSNISGIYGTISHLIGSDLQYTNTTIENLLATNGTISNNLSIAGTVNATTITSGSIYGVNSTIQNLTNTNFSNTNSTVANQYTVYNTSENILVSSITAANAGLTNVSYNNLVGNYIGANYITNNVSLTSETASIGTLINSNSSVGYLTLTSGTFGSLKGSYFSVNNGTISSLLSSNIKTTNETTVNLVSSYITTGNILGTSANFLYGTFGNLLTTDFETTNGTFTNLYITQLTLGNAQITSETVSSSFTNNLTIGNSLNLNGNVITNLTAPSLDSDAINKWYLDQRFNQYTIGNVSGNFTQGQIIVATTEGNIVGYSEFIYDKDTGAVLINGTDNATSVSQGGVLQVSGGASVDKNFYVGGDAHILGYLDMNNQKIMSVATPTTYYDAANKWYVDNRFNEFTIGNVSGNFTQGQVIVASTLGNITGFDTFTFFDNSLNIYTTDEATSLSSGGVLNIYGGARIQKSLYVGGPILQIPTGDIDGRPLNAVPGTVRYNTETQQFEGFGAGNNWGSLGGVVDIAQTTKILASASPSTTDGNLYFYTVGDERLRINSAGNVGIGTSAPSAQLTINRDLLILGTDEATSLSSGGVLNIDGGARIQKSLYIGGPVLQIPTGDITSRPINALPGTVRYNSETQQFEGFGAGNNWGSLGGVVDIAQTTKILASASPSTTDGNLYFYTVGDERLRINSAGNVGIGTSAPTAKLTISGDLLVTGGIDGGGQLITNVTAPSLDLDVVNKWYLDDRFNQYTIGNVNGNFTQGQVIVASTQGNITGFDSFTFFNNSLNIYTTDEATSLSSGGVLNIGGGARIQKSLYIGGPVLQIPIGDISSRPLNALPGTVRYNSETQQFEGFGAGNNWGSLGGVVDIAQTTKILPSASPSTTDGNLYFYTVGDERLRINSAGNVGIGTSAPSAQLTINRDLLILGTDEATSLSSGGVLNIEGGARIQKSLYIGGPVLQIPTGDIISRPTNAVPGTVRYNSETQQFEGFGAGNNWGSLGGVVDIAQTTKILASASPSTTDGNLYFYTVGDERLRINSAGNVGIGTSAPTAKLTVSGDLLVTGGIDGGGQLITNVTAPSFDLDVVNKWYLDDRLNQYTIGNVNGNFTKGQVIVAITQGNITGYDTFMFDGTQLALYTTANATGLTSGGVLRVDGGVTIAKDVYIGGTLDMTNNYITSLPLPINPLDAVNKQYVDYFLGLSNADIAERLFVLDNDVIVPLDVVGLRFPNTDVSSFESMVYLEIPELNVYDQWIINGVLKGSDWVINPTFIGDYQSNVKFNIINTGTHGQIQYINKNLTGTATLRFRASTTSQGGVFANITIGNALTIRAVPDGGTGQSFFTRGCVLIGNDGDPLYTDSQLTYLNDILSIGGTSESLNTSSGAVIINGGVGIQKDVNIGGDVNIGKDVVVGGTLDMTNNNITSVKLPLNPLDAVNKQYVDYLLGVGSGDIHETTFILDNNVTTALDVVGFRFSNTNVSSFEAMVYLEIPELSVYDQWMINGILKGSNWVINQNFIGDYQSNVKFNIINSGTHGQIQYINKNLTGTPTLRFRATTTSQGGIFANITLGNTLAVRPVPDGGTGQTFFTQGCLLIGNNSNPLYTDTQLTYLNDILRIGGTHNSTNTSSGTLIIKGGVGIQKDVYIGGGVYIKDVEITPSQGDIFKEHAFSANNNQLTPQDITGFLFDNTLVRYFHAFVSITIETIDGQLNSGYELKGIQTTDKWMLNSSFIGENTNITFNIKDDGQIQYKSSNTVDWVSTTMKFRAITTSV